MKLSSKSHKDDCGDSFHIELNDNDSIYLTAPTNFKLEFKPDSHGILLVYALKEK